MKLIPIFLLLFLTFQVFSQEEDVDFYEPTEKDIRMGFTFGINYHMFELEKSDWTSLPNVSDSINDVSSQNAPGLSVGMLFNQKISDFFQIRLYPNLLFYCNTIIYDTKYHFTEKIKLRHTELNVPLQFNFSPIQGTGIQVFIGGKYAYIFGNSDYDSSLLFAAKKTSFYAEAGMGYEFKVDKSTVMAELKYSYGLNNLMPKEKNNIYLSSISSIKFNTITLTISYF